MKKEELGIVKPRLFKYEQNLILESGKSLDSFELIYETYGELNEKKSNAILVCHALSGNHHAAGFHSHDEERPGWWDEYIGPGKPINTKKFQSLLDTIKNENFESIGIGFLHS